MNKKARYIVFEGCEGVGKSTQTKKLVDFLINKGYRVLQTKEPGTPLSPLTMQLRSIMLDKQYDDQLTVPARELISQAIRSIHLEKIVKPALTEYDFVIQDRGILSGLSYGTGCGNNFDWLLDLTSKIVPIDMYMNNGRLLYDDVVILTGNISKGLERALSSKQEFTAGDAMEACGTSFLNSVSANMIDMARYFNARLVAVDEKSVDQVFADILNALRIEE